MGENSKANNTRIAKNTLLLSVRMVLMMLLSLYTSRIVLQTLGETDYGIWSVVGGIVVVLGFLNSSMTGGTQRFLNFEMGRGNMDGLKKVFSSAIFIHGCVASIVFLLAETVGLWFLNTHMTIPADRMTAANWIYQFSVFSFLVGVMSVPYNASIIAHEKMSAFAYMTILDAIFKLLIVYLIQAVNFDKMILFGFMLFVVGIVMRIIYGVYCGVHFEECHFKRGMVNKSMAKQMFSFSSWIIVGGLTTVLHSQGIAVCVNMFFGPAVNAAFGLANNVNMKVGSFRGNFQTALNPQLVKLYAAGKLEEMHKLLFRGCRYSCFLLAVFSVPIFIEAPAILELWLKDVPRYTVEFVRLALLVSLINSYSGTLATSQGATGKIQVYQVTLTTIGALHVPFTILFFYLGFPPYFCSWVNVGVMGLEQIFRIWFVSRSTKFTLRQFAEKVIWPCLLVLALASVIPGLMHLYWEGNFVILLVKCAIGALSTALVAFAFGMEKHERATIIEGINNKVFSKFKHKRH